MRRLAVLVVLLAAACTSSAPARRTSTPTTPTAPSAPMTGTGSSPSPRPSPSPSPSRRALDRMSLRERVGQLLMVDCPTSGVTLATTDAIRRYHVGSVILDGTTSAGVSAIGRLSAQLQSLAPKRTGLFVATDQEGGLVQRLRGDGFTDIVSAVEQGAIPPSKLRGYARGWGAQLRAAGVNLNLAPVLDTVPAGFAPNPPIGDLEREYGHTPPVVTAHGLAVARGLMAAGIDATAKHFPGLGRVTGNTDTTAGVTDTTTSPDDPYLAPFRAAVRAGVPFVMISTASYARIDPGVPAAFSSRIITGMLRGDLGFRGVVISDDLGAAQQVADVPVGERAVRFVAAGGDVVLTVDAAAAGEMAAALLDRAKSDPAFKRKVDAAALRVLEAKQARGLLTA